MDIRLQYVSLTLTLLIIPYTSYIGLLVDNLLRVLDQTYNMFQTVKWSVVG